jgi:hypothetical protein
MKAFITGSRAYGSVHDGSDCDLVIFVSEEDLNILAACCEVKADTPIKYPDCFSMRFAGLNLICCTDQECYEAWANGTAMCNAEAAKRESKAIERREAVEVFKALFAKIQKGRK